jgi:lambda family phage tail tape measure protein
MTEIVGRGVIQVSADNTQLKAGIEDAKRSVRSLGGDIGKSVAAGSKSAQRSIEQYVKRVEFSSRTLGKSFRETKLLELAERGATAAQLARADAALKTADAFKKQQKETTLAAGAASYLVRTLTPLLSIGAFTRLVLGANDALLAIKDLSEATGATIPNISALENIGRRTGTTFESVGGILVKFNQALKEADGKNDGSRAIQAIGLDAEKLKKLDPAEALRETALALQGFADDGNRARLVQELFGKSVKEAGPFLRELAEANGLVATATREQVAEADKFNKNLRELRTNVGDAVRALTQDLVPALNDVFASIRGNRAAGGFFKELKDEISANLVTDELRVTVSNIETLQLALSRDPGNPALTKRLAELRAEAAELSKQAFRTADDLKKFAGVAKPLPAATSEVDSENQRLLGRKPAPSVKFSGGGGGKEKDPFGDAVKSLREQIALVGKVTELEKISEQIILGKYGKISAAHAGLLKSLAAELDLRQDLQAQQEARLGVDLAAIKRDLDGMTGAYSAAESVLEAQRDAALISEGEYYGAKLAFIRLNTDAQVQALQAENARLGQEKKTGAELIRQQEQLADNEARIAILRAQGASQTEVLGIQQKRAADLIRQGFEEAEAAAQSYLDSIKRAQQIELKGLGLGNRERGRLRDRSQLEDRFDDQRQQLASQRRAGQITEQQYAEELNRIQRFQAEALRNYDQYYGDLEKKRGDFAVGAQEALSNYIDSARDIAGQTEELFTNAFQGLEDALVEFTKTGKLNFKQLGDSILADINRILIRKNITEPLASAIQEGFSSGGGLGGLLQKGLGALLGGGGGLTVPGFGGGQISLGGAAASATAAAGGAAQVASTSAATAAQTAQTAAITTNTAASAAQTAAITTNTATSAAQTAGATAITAAETAAAAAIAAASVSSVASLAALTAAATTAAAALASVSTSSAASGAASFASAFFSEGGYTGDGGKLQPAGIVHAGEFVQPQEVMREPGARGFMERVRKEGFQPTIAKIAQRGFSEGGFVSAPVAAHAPAVAPTAAPAIAPAAVPALAAAAHALSTAPALSAASVVSTTPAATAAQIAAAPFTVAATAPAVFVSPSVSTSRDTASIQRFHDSSKESSVRVVGAKPAPAQRAAQSVQQIIAHAATPSVPQIVVNTAAPVIRQVIERAGDSTSSLQHIVGGTSVQNVVGGTEVHQPATQRPVVREAPSVHRFVSETSARSDSVERVLERAAAQPVVAASHVVESVSQKPVSVAVNAMPAPAMKAGHALPVNVAVQMPSMTQPLTVSGHASQPTVTQPSVSRVSNVANTSGTTNATTNNAATSNANSNTANTSSTTNVAPADAKVSVIRVPLGDMKAAVERSFSDGRIVPATVSVSVPASSVTVTQAADVARHQDAHTNSFERFINSTKESFSTVRLVESQAAAPLMARDAKERHVPSVRQFVIKNESEPTAQQIVNRISVPTAQQVINSAGDASHSVQHIAGATNNTAQNVQNAATNQTATTVRNIAGSRSVQSVQNSATNHGDTTVQHLGAAPAPSVHRFVSETTDRSRSAVERVIERATAAALGSASRVVEMVGQPPVSVSVDAMHPKQPIGTEVRDVVSKAPAVPVNVAVQMAQMMPPLSVSSHVAQAQTAPAMSSVSNVVNNASGDTLHDSTTSNVSSANAPHIANAKTSVLRMPVGDIVLPEPEAIAPDISALIGRLSRGQRAIGGPVSANSLYRVNERGPEILEVGGKQYLMTGQQGGEVKNVKEGDANRTTIVHNNFVVNGQPTRATQEQLSLAAGRGVQRALVRGGA